MTGIKIALWGEHPGVGKDTVGQILQDGYGFIQKQFKTKLYEDAYNYLNDIFKLSLSYEEWVKIVSDRKYKDEVFYDVLTPREILFEVQTLRKALDGQDYYAKYLESKLPQDGNIVITDLGFDAELAVALNNGFRIIEVRRNDNSYKKIKDIRKRFMKFNDYVIDNNGSVKDLEAEVGRIIYEIVKYEKR